MKRISALVSVLGWITFIVIDYHWNRAISEAVELRQGTYGEIFGPLSFFRPIALYSSFCLSLFTSILEIISMKKKEE
jgi:hypothetical protein